MKNTGKRIELVTVHGKTKTFQRRQVVGTDKKDEKKQVQPQWYDDYKKYKLTRLPFGVPKDKVTINPKGVTDTEWVMKWKDDKNRTITVYTKKFLQENAKDKWDRIKNINPKIMSTIRSKSNELLHSEDDNIAQSAAIINIISNAGLRPGSIKGFDQTGNRGVSTLSPDNIEIDGDIINFDFKGKSHKQNKAIIVSKDLAEYLKKRIKERKGENFLFTVNKNNIFNTFRNDMGFKGLKLKDMRTYVATDLARKVLYENPMPPLPLPDDKKDIKKIVQKKLNVCFDIVSTKLNNTPAMAKNSYIHPNVIDSWIIDLGLKKEELLKAEEDDKEIKTLEEIKEDFNEIEDYNEIDVDDFGDEEDDDVVLFDMPEWWDYTLDEVSQFKFYDKENLGKKRSQMPQVDEENIDEFLIHFSDKTKVSKLKTSINNIKPTQAEINEDKVINMIKEDYDWINRKYIISSDNYLLDGHHAYAMGLEIDEDEEVVVYKIDLPISELISRTNKLKLSTKADLYDNIVKGIDIVDFVSDGIPFITDMNLEEMIQNLCDDGVEKADRSHLTRFTIINKIGHKQTVYKNLQGKEVSANKQHKETHEYDKTFLEDVKNTISELIGKSYPDLDEKSLKLHLVDPKSAKISPKNPRPDKKSQFISWYKTKNFHENGIVGIKINNKIHEKKVESYKNEIDFENKLAEEHKNKVNQSEEIFNKIKQSKEGDSGLTKFGVFSVGETIIFKEGDKDTKGTIKGIKFNEKYDKNGTAVIETEDGKILSRSLNKVTKFVEKDKDSQKEVRPKAKIFERPDMESPVYVVEINNIPRYIQKWETNTYPEWHEVEKKDGLWNDYRKDNIYGVGFTKDEAIDHLMNSVKVPYESNKDLKEDYLKIEQKFGKYLNDNFDDAKKIYLEKFGRVINTDNARELSEDYVKNKGELSSAVHEPSSSFVKEVYKDLLDQKPISNKVIFTEGGTGSGKTSSLANFSELNKLQDDADAVYDSNMNHFKNNTKKIDQALEKGRNVIVIQVYRDPMVSFKEGVIPRMLRSGRSVPIEAHISTHDKESFEALSKTIDHYSENNNVKFFFIDNSTEKGKQKIINFSDLKNKFDISFENLRKDLYKYTKQLYENKEITEEQYKGLTVK